MVTAAMRRVIWACCAMAAILLPLHLRAEAVPEYELKAAFIYNFALFAEWPADRAFEGNTLNICVNMRSPLRLPLAMLADRAVAGRRVTVRSPSLDKLAACHVLFVDGRDREPWLQIRKALESASVLTISDDEEIGRSGSIILLAMEQGRMVFDIDMRAARQASLVLSSKLLRLARRVK